MTPLTLFPPVRIPRPVRISRPNFSLFFALAIGSLANATATAQSSGAGLHNPNALARDLANHASLAHASGYDFTGESIFDSPAQSQEVKKNSVVVMGMIHGGHTTSQKYGIDKVKSLIRDIKPDYVFCEIPPDRLELAATQFRETGVISEPRVKVFPEYVEVLFPLTKELVFEIVPCAGWTKEMADNRNRKLAELQTTHADQFREMTEAEAKMDETVAREGGGDDNPVFINSDRYDEIVKLGLEPYNRHFNEILGPGGWDNINKSHYGLIARNLQKHAGEGKTILIMFGAGHKYWFVEQLRKRSDIELVPLKKYLKE